MDALVDRVRSEYGTFSGLFVNAGVTRFVPFESMTEAVYDELFAVNAKGPYFTVQKLAALLGAGSGVVLTTSVSNVLGIPMISAYAASKAALRSMTRSLARELVAREIRVNAVSPGPIDTGILERALPDETARQTKAQMIAANPMLRFGDPREVAKAAVFLMFDATYTTDPSSPWTEGALSCECTAARGRAPSVVLIEADGPARWHAGGSWMAREPPSRPAAARGRPGPAAPAPGWCRGSRRSRARRWRRWRRSLRSTTPPWSAVPGCRS